MMNRNMLGECLFNRHLWIVLRSSNRVPWNSSIAVPS
jgi:hypothetical protein